MNVDGESKCNFVSSVENEIDKDASFVAAETSSPAEKLKEKLKYPQKNSQTGTQEIRKFTTLFHSLIALENKTSPPGVPLSEIVWGWVPGLSSQE